MIFGIDEKEDTIVKALVQFIDRKAMELVNLEYKEAVAAVVARLYSVDEMNAALNKDVEIKEVKRETVVFDYVCSTCGPKRIELFKGEYTFNCPFCSKAFDVLWLHQGGNSDSVMIREQGV